MDDVRDPQEFEDPLSNYEPPCYASELERALAEETVSAIQSQPYSEVSAAAPLREAVDALRRWKISSVLVVDHGKLVGIFTERDVLEKVADRYAELADVPVAEVMTSNPLVVYDCDPAGAALAAIAAAGYRHVPVLSAEDEIIGMLSPRRVFDFLQERLEPTPG